MTRARALPLALLAAAFGVGAQAPRVSVDSPRPLMLAALESATGEAHGQLIGPVAEALSQRFGTPAPVLVHVTTERRLRQPGCSRLKVLLSQDGVVLPGTRVGKKHTIEFGINLCRDGQPPRSPS